MVMYGACLIFLVVERSCWTSLELLEMATFCACANDLSIALDNDNRIDSSRLTYERTEVLIN
jgi:hypothetical protein